MANPLHETIPANVRKIAYAVYALTGVALGATQVGYSAAEMGQPVWLVVAMAVFGFVGGAFGLTAASNTPSHDHATDL
jgi:hypothetical protein